MNKFSEFDIYCTNDTVYDTLVKKLMNCYDPSETMPYYDIFKEFKSLIFSSHLLYDKGKDVKSKYKKYKIGTQFFKDISAGIEVVLEHTPFGKYFTYEKDTGILKIRDDIDIEEYIEFMKYMSENRKGNVIPYIVPTADEIRQIKEELRNQQ